MNLKEAFIEISKVVRTFLLAEGGYTNGYLTYLSGAVVHNAPGILQFSTPKSNLLTPKEIKRKGEVLHDMVRAILSKWEIEGELTFKPQPLKYRCYKTVISIIIETTITEFHE